MNRTMDGDRRTAANIVLHNDEGDLGLDNDEGDPGIMIWAFGLDQQPMPAEGGGWPDVFFPPKECLLSPLSSAIRRAQSPI